MKIRISNLSQALAEVLNAIEQVNGELHYDSTYQSDFISIEEASDLLNLSTTTIYGKACRRQIPVYRNGKKLLFSRKELDVWAKTGLKLSNRKQRKSISLREFKMRYLV